MKIINAVKVSLKKIPIIYELNAKLKASSTQKKTDELNNRFESMIRTSAKQYSPADVPNAVRYRLAQRGIVARPIRKGEMKIFWVGANKEQDYSGFIQSLRRFGEVAEFYHSSGQYGQEFSDKWYDLNVVERNGRALLAQIEDVNQKSGKIDVLIGQMWANFISVDVLNIIRDMGIVVINISMDDRLPQLWDVYGEIALGSVGLSSGLDLVLTSSPECCARYFLNDCPSVFWPMGSDPDLFKPALLKDIDVVFVGNNYGNRGKIVNELLKNGINVQAFGNGWSNGYIGPEKMANVFGRSKIILGIGTIAYSKDIYTLKLRDFDATMAGALYVTHRNPDLLNIFVEGEEIECYLSTEEAVSKIVYYLKHDVEREEIASAALDRTRNFHTWDIRLCEAFSYAGFIEPIEQPYFTEKFFQ